MGIQGTHSLTNPVTSRRHVIQLPKLFIARLTRQSSQTQRHRHGHVIIDLGAAWQITHCGPSGPRPEAPEFQDCGSCGFCCQDELGWQLPECELEGEAEREPRRRERIRFSRISDSSSGVGRFFSSEAAVGSDALSRKWVYLYREEVRTLALSLSICCRNRLRVMTPPSWSAARWEASTRASCLLSLSLGSSNRASDAVSRSVSLSDEVEQNSGLLDSCELPIV